MRADLRHPLRWLLAALASALPAALWIALGYLYPEVQVPIDLTSMLSLGLGGLGCAAATLAWGTHGSETQGSVSWWIGRLGGWAAGLLMACLVAALLILR